MEITEIVLLAAGGIIFILSFLIPDKKGEVSEQSRSLAKSEIADMVSNEMESIRGQVDDAVEEAVTYAMEKTERSLERLSNEKIMAVNEYSDTVLAEIHKNHEEAMFLYDMLNNKHTNLKETVSTVDRTVKEVEERLNGLLTMTGVPAVPVPEGQVPVVPQAAGPAMVTPAAAMPAGFVPQASAMAGSMPHASVPAGSMLQASVPAGSRPQASVSAASSPHASVTAGSRLQASVPAASVQQASAMAGSMSRASVPAAPVPPAPQSALERLAAAKARKEQQLAESRAPSAPAASTAAAPVPSAPTASVPADAPPVSVPVGTVPLDASPVSVPVGTVPLNASPVSVPVNTMPPLSGVADSRVSFLQERTADGRNNNERILELYQQGKSKVAIAKELGLGVGEVKLVIDLFRNQ